MIRTRVFSDEDLENALDSMEEFCKDEDIDSDDIIKIQIITRNADSDSSVAIVYRD